MSRTDKDRPYWVDAEYWEPWHYRCGNPNFYYWGYVSRTRPERECDLPPVPLYSHYRNVSFRRNGYKRCGWVPVWEKHDEHGRNRPYPPIPKWFIDHVWNNPARVRTRDECRKAVKEYRANGEVDVEPTIDQHHHGAGWLWW